MLWVLIRRTLPNIFFWSYVNNVFVFIFTVSFVEITLNWDGLLSENVFYKNIIKESSIKCKKSYFLLKTEGKVPRSRQSGF